MATRIELPKKIVNDSFQTRLQSLDRAAKQATNDLIKQALADEANQLRAAIATMTEIK